MANLSTAKIKQTMTPRRLRKDRAGGDGNEFPLRVCKVTRVDPKRMIVSLYALTGNGDTYDNVALTFPNAGARHFIGAIPDLNDLCVVGYSSAESGKTRTPYIVGWLVPGPNAGYDWLMTSPTREEEVALTPALREALQGSFGRRRHKLKQMEAGNVVASSSQGSDLVLNESATLSNRRGNEITLRDQDQALVIRSLQQFHAGAGVRLYSGMVQRDSTLIPTQMFADSVDWSSSKQVDSEGNPILASDLDSSPLSGSMTPDDVFSKGLAMGYTDPSDILRRGLFVDSSGMMYDSLVVPSAVYGGKPLFRVSVDPGTNGVTDVGSDVFSEYRIEVSHTSDGTLPVTEQTDGIDIDRLLPSAPDTGVDGSGDANPLNRSPNESMVSFVLGTAIGNDPINDRDSYGKPLIASLYDKNGAFAPGIRAAEDTTPITDHSAFLLRVRNPTDPKAPEAFMSITKGGAFRTYFPGSGSKAHEEFFQTGKRITLGADLDGQSERLEADGTISLRNTGKGRQTDNVGVELHSTSGAVTIFGGGSISEGAGSPSSNPNLTAAGASTGVRIRSSRGILIEAVETTKISGRKIQIDDSDSITVSSNSSLSLLASESATVSTKTLNVVVNGRADYLFGGPKNGLPSNGPSRNTTFTSTPLTGGTGGVVDRYEVVFGGREEIFRVGRHDTTVEIGSYNISTMSPATTPVGNGSGIHLSTGLQLNDNRLDLELSGASLTSNVGNATLQATKGSAVVRGTLGVNISSPTSVSILAPSVVVTVPTPFVGGVLTDGCIDSLTGRSFLSSGTVGVSTFRVGV